jgi:phosphoribosylformylglycinamidine synthase
LLDDIATLVRPPFTTEGDAVLLIGKSTPGMAGSAYAALAGISAEDSPPGIELDREAALQSFIREAIGRGLVASAQDVSGGGLAVALGECCIWSGLGAKLRLGILGSPAIELFGESPSRLVLSCRPRHAPAIELLARQFGLDSNVLGSVGGDRLSIELTGMGATGAAEERGSRIADALDVSIADLRHTWDHGLARALGVEQGPVHDAEAAGTAASGKGN